MKNRFKYILTLALFAMFGSGGLLAQPGGDWPMDSIFIGDDWDDWDWMGDSIVWDDDWNWPVDTIVWDDDCDDWVWPVDSLGMDDDDDWGDDWDDDWSNGDFDWPNGGITVSCDYWNAWDDDSLTWDWDDWNWPVDTIVWGNWDWPNDSIVWDDWNWPVDTIVWGDWNWPNDSIVWNDWDWPNDSIVWVDWNLDSLGIDIDWDEEWGDDWEDEWEDDWENEGGFINAENDTQDLLDATDWIEVMSVYPNPVINGTATVSLKMSQEGMGQFELLTITGQRVYMKQLMVLEGTQQIEIEMDGLAPGTYLLSLRIGDKAIKTERILKY